METTIYVCKSTCTNQGKQVIDHFMLFRMFLYLTGIHNVCYVSANSVSWHLWHLNSVLEHNRYIIHYCVYILQKQVRHRNIIQN